MESVVWHLRLNEEDKDNFDERCDELGVKPNEMCREVIKAFAENRVKIIPTTGQIRKGEIYVTGE